MLLSQRLLNNPTCAKISSYLTNLEKVAQMEPIRSIKIRKILLDNNNWWTFYNQYKHLIRNSIIINVCKLLACGTAFLGFHQYTCQCCGNSKKVFQLLKLTYQIAKNVSYSSLFFAAFGYEPLQCQICKSFMQLEVINYPAKRIIIYLAGMSKVNGEANLYISMKNNIRIL